MVCVNDWENTLAVIDANKITSKLKMMVCFFTVLKVLKLFTIQVFMVVLGVYCFANVCECLSEIYLNLNPALKPNHVFKLK